VNVCLAWKSGHLMETWYYVTSAHIGDQADWKDPLPKPDSLLSIKYDEERQPFYNANVNYVKEIEISLQSKLKPSYPDALCNQLVEIVFTSEDYCLGSIQNMEPKLFCLFPKNLFKKEKKIETLKKGALFKVAAMLMDVESRVPYLCYDFHSYPSSKRLELLRHAELKEKQVEAYTAIISSSSLPNHLDDAWEYFPF
jgi:hypothetical protein